MFGLLRDLLSRNAARGAEPATLQRGGPAPTVQSHRAQGNAHVEGGRWADAAACYRAALVLDPSFVPAMVNLAYALLAQGQLDEAMALLLRVVDVAPNNVDAHFMLADTLMKRGQAAQAVFHLDAVIRQQPDFSLAYPLLCQAHYAQGDIAAARDAVDAGLGLNPKSADLHLFDGNLELHQGHFESAIERYETALSFGPDNIDALANLANALILAGRHTEAEARLGGALSKRPASASTCHVLGRALRGLGRLTEAVIAYKWAVELVPEDAAAHQNLGVLYQSQGKHAAAAESFERALALQPDSVEAMCNVGNAQQALGRLAAAESSFRRALTAAPDYDRAHALLATLQVELGDIPAALVNFRRAVELNPESVETRSNQLFVLSSVDADDYLVHAKDYGERVARHAKPFTQWKVERAGARQASSLRVGIVSGDLRSHPVGYFIESVLVGLKARQVEVHAFPTNSYRDEVSDRLKTHLAGWTPIVGMDDLTAASRIRDERIDVLVDLAGHTAHNRLPIFAFKPAPVQASWLGYFASTGVPTIDYIVADPFSTPQQDTVQFSETVWRLPHSRLCFTEPGDARDFPVASLPAAARGYVTFGCFQNLSKVTDDVLRTWRQVLDGLKTARLRLQSKQLADEDQRKRFKLRLRETGLDIARVILAAPGGRSSYLAAYREVDIVLDTFPFPGGTTTCEALWMGVPTVTLAGRSMLSRQGEALLRCAGLHDWVAADRASYVALAIQRARDMGALQALRQELRQRVVASPLFDGEAFAETLAVTFKEMAGCFGERGNVQMAWQKVASRSR